MAVIVRYIVVRNGEEKMTFATKKEADAHDKMLDIADDLFEFLEKSGIEVDERKLEDISLLLAQKRDELIPILRGTRPKKMPENKVAAKKEEPGQKPPAKSKSKSGK